MEMWSSAGSNFQGVHAMSSTLIRGSVFSLCLLIAENAMGQQAEPAAPEPVKPTGPAAKKADELIQAYTSRIEKEIDQGRKEVDRLRAELHELIDVRYAMSDAIAELRGELAAKGTYSGEMYVPVQASPKPAPAPATATVAQYHRDFVYGLGSALPKAPTEQERAQIRRLAPRADLKRMIERLRAEVEETRTDVDQLAYQLLELRAGIPRSFQGMGGGMMGMGGGMGGGYGQWFGSMGTFAGGGMGGGMR
jgi:chorismate mutase